MKILCPCGAKFAVDVTPEMAQKPVQFICPACGLDSSAAVNEQILQEVSIGALAPVAAPASVAAPVESPPPAPAVAPAHARIHVSRPSAHAVAAAAPTSTPQFCLKHSGQAIAHQCMVCNKPMCLKCMELFGYVCSPFCRTRGEARRLEIPEYAGQKSVSEARLWRKVGMVTAAIAVALSLIVGAWVWYAWFGSRPKPVFAVRFPEGIHSGQAEFCGKNQIVFLHGLTLSRYDLKAKKEIWSRQLVEKKGIADAIALHTKAIQARIARARNEGWERIPSMPSPEELAEDVERSVATALQLYVQGSNLWVTAESGKLVSYEWTTGNPGTEIPLAVGYLALARQGEELTLRTENEFGQRVVTHINLVTATKRVELIGEPFKPVAGAPVAKAGGMGTKKPLKVAAVRPANAGLPDGSAADQPMDPATVAAQAQRLPLPAKIALPATVANAMNQERIMQELNDSSGLPNALDASSGSKDRVSFIASQYGYFQFSVRLLEERLVSRKVMKDPPKNSALNGNVNVTQTMEIANELLNEMQRSRVGDSVTEDESRYLVTVHCPDNQAPDWIGEVVGPPSLFPLKSVNVVAGGSSLTVLDKANKKLWVGSLTHKVRSSSGMFDENESRFGEAPCVEHDGRLYICDETMLTAFDLRTGNVFWRLPSVGVAGLIFDEKGMLYINTTTASPDSVKYSRQIDVSQKVSDVIVKVDPKSGRTLWSTQAGGFISYLSGKFIYVWSANDADDDKDSPLKLGLETPSYVRIKRLDPGNGKIMWDHYQPRAPLDVKFNENIIQIVFKQELQVLKYLSF
jgi:hypothetical protein